ncbi:ribosomal RNA small subunit methyltransferase I [Paenibacillus baekrokdamisoli]|uniref:Ribosomal RNA small subunit methyltransferase I n=1 Tax=Paenibacillus baekrokdamisoli TaxID=1712516 RepID=A0A3G9JEG7_9BACL|nr:16S rRNA (cytidine(1402)-2'-O)-methyltransferase [Paenibacillus baekrokdamisoli]MBB3072967.1 16S rRNA (cytidine1402-2'-O)-methyltransferase [Paenibacillus baekrokdamisoli]BBH23363.1 ribosomal RNA small subunit methyltransferase I [Paenibacillus baekrokdamisoli]
MKVQRSFKTASGGELTTSTGTLYLVGTPIGNLEDMTFRAIRTLKEVDLIAAEDTRQTRKLLTHFEIPTRLVSYHEHNKEASGIELLRLLEDGQSIALVSDAGLPAISDPGADLVAAAAAQGIAVVPIPGANAALSALIVSGLPTDRFLFVGFPPRDRKPLNSWLERIRSQEGTLLCYESPHRVAKTLTAMLEQWGDRQVAMVREITKRHEEVARGPISECLEWLKEHPPLGEYCLVIAGIGEAEQQELLGDDKLWWEDLDLQAHVERYELQTGDRKEAIKRAAIDRGLQKRDVYNEIMRK